MAEPEAEVRRMRELSCSGLWNVHSLQGMHDRYPVKQGTKLWWVKMKFSTVPVTWSIGQYHWLTVTLCNENFPYFWKLVWFSPSLSTCHRFSLLDILILFTFICVRTGPSKEIVVSIILFIYISVFRIWWNSAGLGRANSPARTGSAKTWSIAR